MPRSTQNPTMHRLLIQTALIAVFALPQGAVAQDTLYTREGRQILGYDTHIRTFDAVYRQMPAGPLKIISTRELYIVHYADGHTWPKKSGTRDARIAKYIIKRDEEKAIKDRRRERRAGKMATTSNNLLACAPGLHEAGDFPGISIGIAYEGFLGSKRRFSIGASLTHMWAGTNEQGKMYNGDLRTNINANYGTTTFRYHPIGGRFDLDPFIGLGLAVGNYRRSASGILQYRYYSEFPANYLLLSPQVEVGVNITPNEKGRLTFQVIGATGPQFIGGRREGLFSTLGLLRVGFRL